MGRQHNQRATAQWDSMLHEMTDDEPEAAPVDPRTGLPRTITAEQLKQLPDSQRYLYEKMPQSPVTARAVSRSPPKQRPKLDPRDACSHGRDRRLCKECGKNNVCKHRRVRDRCRDCNPPPVEQHASGAPCSSQQLVAEVLTQVFPAEELIKTTAALPAASVPHAKLHQWLAQLGLEPLATAFIEKDYVDMAVIQEMGLDEEDLDYLEISDPEQRAVLLAQRTAKELVTPTAAAGAQLVAPTEGEVAAATVDCQPDATELVPPNTEHDAEQDTEQDAEQDAGPAPRSMLDWDLLIKDLSDEDADEGSAKQAKKAAAPSKPPVPAQPKRRRWDPSQVHEARWQGVVRRLRAASVPHAKLHQWLAQLGLEPLAAAFIEKDYVDMAVIQEMGLDEEDLDYLEISDPEQRAVLLAQHPTSPGESTAESPNEPCTKQLTPTTPQDEQNVQEEEEPGSSKCAGCLHQAPKLSRCSRCQWAYYCSRDCQSKHFKKHKAKCLQKQLQRRFSCRRWAVLPDCNASIRATPDAEAPVVEVLHGRELVWGLEAEPGWVRLAADGEFAGGLGRAGSRWVALRHQGKMVMITTNL